MARKKFTITIVGTYDNKDWQYPEGLDESQKDELDKVSLAEDIDNLVVDFLGGKVSVQLETI